ncbi:hypothetical protein MASR2M48_27200 [Spirochaetota bacterium]
MEKAAAAGFSTLKALRSATTQDLAVIDGFGDIMAATLSEGLKSLGPQMDAVLATGLVAIAPHTEATGPLAGLSFCFTGELRSMKRSRAQALVTSLGASVRSSVTKGLSYLVTNDPGSGSEKNKKAGTLGVAILDEEAFLDIVSPGALP